MPPLPSSFGDLTFSRRLLLIAAAFIGLGSWPAAHAQVIGALDKFTYTTSTINGDAPSTTGSATWTASSTANSSISADGTQAVIVTNGGTTGSGSTLAYYPFVVTADTRYTVNITFKFSGPIGTGFDCWAGVGFNSVPGGGN